VDTVQEVAGTNFDLNSSSVAKTRKASSVHTAGYVDLALGVAWMKKWIDVDGIPCGGRVQCKLLSSTPAPRTK
jgi:hypothetical protein